MLEYFYRWCIFMSASPGDKYYKIWEFIEAYREYAFLEEFNDINNFLEEISEELLEEDRIMVKLALNRFLKTTHLMILNPSKLRFDFVESYDVCSTDKYLVKFTVNNATILGKHV